MAINRANDKASPAIFADLGPRNHLGEGSIALAERLGVPSNPHRGGATQDIVYVVFPDSGNGKPRTLGEIEAEGQALFEAWGGMGGSWMPACPDGRGSETVLQIVAASLGALLGLALRGTPGLGTYWPLAWMIGPFAVLDPRVAAVTSNLSALALLAALIIAGREPAAAARNQVDAEDGGESLRTLDLQLALYASTACSRSSGT